MQDKAKNNKKKRELVFKPYKQGTWHNPYATRQGLKTMVYFLVFVFFYLILGAALQFEQTWLRVIANLLLVIVCGMILYINGAHLGEAEAALGEIAYGREQSGKTVSPKDVERCYHPLKGWYIFLISIIPALLICIPHALMAEKQVYSLQALPSWINAYEGHEEIMAPFSYYLNIDTSMHLMDIIRLIARVLIFPFANIATADRPDLMLVMDRLSPILAALPMLGFPLGYLTGPRSRAAVHGDIKTSTKRRQRREKKAIKARQARAKKNEII